MQKTDFNRDWTVQKDGSNEILHVNLPDDAMIREERSKENKTASASAYFAGGKYIYTKIFDLSENETRQTLILEFEAVYQNATVFLNGRQVAEHPYGYTNFFVDITGKVIAGTNELKVVADNADVPNSRWYSGSGIYREVHLYRSGSSYIRPEGLKVQIVDLNTIHIFTDAVMQPDEKIVLEIFNDTGKSYLPKAQMSPSPSQMHTSGLPKILIYIPARQPFYKMELPLILPEPLSESVPFPGEKMDFL
ncbi:glycosyl hydrolase family 2, sugar binding domain protein [Coprococcus comes ATCC 27758]|uniref:Glycosyl hydrolase family 2, sugar binding domain protein n=1 Tax=Coprococcus comes ATCC 27758 TaxID=470146 RepID=C0B6B2_9FIRM|nr:glycosyl hydrolase family 2, sugar binding domain protein [Coprococcus comes ATCC 27758]